jgi:glycosyl transferase family 11
MITAKFAGRLGNNMFQMAAAIGLATKHGESARFDKGDLAKVQLDHYFSGVLALCTRCKVSEVYEEPTFRFHQIQYTKNMQLRGWWQSEKHFEHCRDEVLRAFNFNPGTEELRGRGVVGVHVRRGDYVNLVGQFPTVTLEYLEEAMNFFPGYSFLFFSDDIEWCKAHFKGDQYMFSTGRSPQRDIEVMSQCEHQVISNSSFSWWAAWLNLNPNKKVIAPKVWFGPKNSYYNQTQDVIPARWITI